MASKRPKRGPFRDMSVRYRAFRWTVLALGRMLFGFTVHGVEKVPETGPLIVAANHRRYVDPILVTMAVPRRVQWMAKKEIFVFPFEKVFSLAGTFPVDRQKGGRAALRTALSLLHTGWALGIFPEGTRRKEYDPDHVPKSGVGMLATRGRAPILPVFVGQVPRVSERLRGARLHIYIGDLITSNNTSRGVRAYKEISDEVLGCIYSLGRKGGGG